LLSSLAIAYIYLMEYFIAWYSGDPYERWVFGHRLFGHTYWYGGWIMLVVNVGLAQLLWFKRARQNLKLVFVIGVLINIGMWFERFVIIVGSLYQDFLPANWGVYFPTWVDIGTYVGTLGAFFMMYLLFIKFLPLVAIAEVKGAMPQADPHHPLGGADGGRS
jgi:molybdopterin-containing oxidoreductase family membrane subunit